MIYFHKNAWTTSVLQIYSWQLFVSVTGTWMCMSCKGLAVVRFFVSIYILHINTIIIPVMVNCHVIIVCQCKIWVRCAVSFSLLGQFLSPITVTSKKKRAQQQTCILTKRIKQVGLLVESETVRKTALSAAIYCREGGHWQHLTLNLTLSSHAELIRYCNSVVVITCVGWMGFTTVGTLRQFEDGCCSWAYYEGTAPDLTLCWCH